MEKRKIEPDMNKTTSRMLDLLRPGEPIYINDKLNRITALCARKGIKVKAKTVYVFEDLTQAPAAVIKVILQ